MAIIAATYHMYVWVPVEKENSFSLDPFCWAPQKAARMFHFHQFALAGFGCLIGGNPDLPGAGWISPSL